MVSYAQYPPTMQHDFELYATQEQQFDLLATSQPAYLPTSQYLDPSFSAPFDPASLHAFSEAPRSQDLRFHYDAIAQGVKPSYQQQQYSPAGSPNSGAHSFDIQPPNLSTSSESGASVSSSAMGSPSLHPQFHDQPWGSINGLGLAPGIVQSTSGYDYESLVATDKSNVSSPDPTLIQPYPTQLNFPQSPYPAIHTTPSPRFPFIEQPPSPAPSMGSNHSHHAGSRQFKRGSQSPYLHTQSFQPYHNGFNGSRRQSNASILSHQSVASRKSGSSYELDDESREKGLCPIPECGRVFKDLKAHMLTHQNERPEKCPIGTCEYHLKGFARKYDKNRHTLTHYKGTMVCGFCPGSGSAAEKSFNRADVFKRHLTSVHGVEQAPPNSRKRSPSGKKAYTATQENLRGTCSTCSVTFNNAQDFYEHLDDCVLRVLAHPRGVVSSHAGGGNNNKVAKTSGGRGPRAGLTFSKGGVAMTASGRKKRKNYPVSWGCATDKMKMKKRVLCVYDGPRRLWKDDMMLDQEFEVRMKLPDGKSYITDLDIQTLNRAEALHGATAEEKGPWIPDNIRDHHGGELEDFIV
ncbi:zinc finger-containing protein [Lophium mytilinum]|uniref:Zinc finger-containing protein n=1 Tax=Lophium mytilinum TaxID=390894 RepID=A0A6A6RBZ4_9PEZI|nr:zinc finger-containing protein [Lophium mytilinum]